MLESKREWNDANSPDNVRFTHVAHRVDYASQMRLASSQEAGSQPARWVSGKHTRTPHRESRDEEQAAAAYRELVGTKGELRSVARQYTPKHGDDQANHLANLRRNRAATETG
jgi:hypothetical protein